MANLHMTLKVIFEDKHLRADFGSLSYPLLNRTLACVGSFLLLQRVRSI